MVIANELVNLFKGTLGSEAVKAIGRRGLYSINGMRFPIKVVDVRIVYGRVDFQIQSIGGLGFKWVGSGSVVLDNE